VQGVDNKTPLQKLGEYVAKSDPSLLPEHLHVSCIDLPPLPTVLARCSAAKDLGLEQAGGYFVNLLPKLSFS